ncbi:MAG: DNA polymerase III subunit alpha [PVC group bacterium]
MSSSDFVHLHVHTEYSLLDGACRLPVLLERASRLKMPALAITDHGSMSGVVKFYKAALDVGIKPIIGCEFYVAPAGRFDKTAGPKAAASHLTLLARDRTGYQNLLVLISRAHLEGFYYKPRIDRELLEERHQGLIGLSGCLKGEIARALLGDDRPAAEGFLAYYSDLFGRDNFYLELMDHGLPEQKRLTPLLLDLSRRSGVPPAATNDVHYVNREDAYSQEVLLCIQTGRQLEDKARMKLASEEFYLKSAQEMGALFGEVPEALLNTRRIADRCSLEMEFGLDLLPRFEPPPGKTPPEYLRELCEKGIAGRYGRETETIRERLEHELKVIEGKRFASYFLIVWDLIRYAKVHKIPVGPGRGSVAGSIVAYLLGITDIDPFRHDLLFERFLNPNRTTMPDIDMDISDQGRAELIKYSSQKYGEERVCQIITFGSMKARAVIRDVGRVMGMPYGEVDRIAKLVPPGPHMTLQKALQAEPKLQALYEKDARLQELFDASFKLEGISRHAGTHAAGVLISRRPLIENVPLRRGKDDEVITQFDMHDAEEVGLLKMDFLGLRTLSVIQNTLDLIEKIRGEVIGINAITLDDPETFSLLSKANTMGVFQLEGSGMRDLSTRIGLKRFDDILDLVALYRPGPMHMLEDYISRKHGKIKIKYAHPLLEPILKDTYGVMLYQEQVMLIANRLGGFTLAKADTLRQAMAKKNAEKMAQLGESFIRGAMERGIARSVAENIFQDMSRFAAYGFNKSHSAAYAMIAYRTAYLKAHYPREFMASLLTSEMNDMDKMMSYVAECREMGIEVMPPDINESEASFTVVGKNIRFGLNAIKNVGAVAVAAILSARREGGAFDSFFRLLERLDLSAVNKKVLETLIKCGALDSLPGFRSQKLEVLDGALQRAHLTRKDRENGQSTLFAQFETEKRENGETGFPEMDEWHQNQCLAMEKELMGMYISGHPLSAHEKIIRSLSTHSILQLRELRDGTQVRVGGIIEQVKEQTLQKTGRTFAFCQMEDLTGVVEVTAWSDEYRAFGHLLQPGKIVFVEGKVKSRDRGSNVQISMVYPLEEAQEHFARALHVDLHLAALDGERIQALRQVLGRVRGRCPVYLDFAFATGEKVIIQAGEQYRVQCTPQLIKEIEDLLGENTAFIKTR